MLLPARAGSVQKQSSSDLEAHGKAQHHKLAIPRLHKYRERNACYVLTAIRGAVISYQLTPNGERKLIAAALLASYYFVPMQYRISCRSAPFFATRR